MIVPIIFGIAGTKLSKEEIELFSVNKAVGFILFSRNIESKKQLIELTDALKRLYPEKKLPIFIDQEGGRVARIKPPIASRLYPSAEHFSNVYNKDRLAAKLELKANYIQLMSELKEFGIDSPCAPVCDLFFDGASDVIGNRSFGNSPDKVIDLCKSAIAGIQHSGGLPFIKHIPGHGRAFVDSHFDLPIVDTPLEELESTDFRVFRELASEKVWGMTAHIVYTSLDPELPATISKKVITYIRNNIGYKGKLVSDDLGMYALHGEIGKQRSTLKRVINLAQNNLEWRQDYSQPLKDLFDIDTHQVTNLSIIELCKKKLAETKGPFLESLSKVTKMSIEAGCDIALHCSGDIDEMRAICNVNIKWGNEMTYCDYSNQEKYPFELPKLPYEKDAFSPNFSSETFDYHHGKHHNAYVTNLNNLLKDNKEFTEMDLEQIIAKSSNSNAAIFNNAAQIWNHTFFWHSIKPNGGGKPHGNIADLVKTNFGSYDNFVIEFKQAAVSQFGSGWAWLVYNSKDKKLQIIKTTNAETPLTQGLDPLIACDVWEHAYYIDYRNKRPDYVSIFIEKMINWDFAEMHLNRARQ